MYHTPASAAQRVPGYRLTVLAIGYRLTTQNRLQAKLSSSSSLLASHELSIVIVVTTIRGHNVMRIISIVNAT